MVDGDVLEAYRLLIADVYELAGLSRRVSEREAAAEGATVARWHVLSAVADEALAVPQIAHRLGQVRQGVQRVVDELVADGHLARSPNPANVRSPRVEPTPAGRAVLDRLWAASADSRRTVLAAAGLDGSALAAARDTVRELARALRAVEVQQSHR